MNTSKNRIGETLARLKAQGKKALVSYVVNGDPRVDTTLDVMHTLVESGADILELGVPFSDPMAEGPVIQKAHERALEHGASLTSSLAVVAEFRQTNTTTPVVLMGYANPVERMGYRQFAAAASAAGVDGLLTVDLPPEEAQALNIELKQVNIENIFLIAPTTTDARIASIAALASGFLYYVSLKGVTGAGHLDVQSVSDMTGKIKQATSLPILTGFGIKDASSAKAVGALSDGVIVGSALVSVMAQSGLSNDEINTQLTNIMLPIREALDSL